MKKLLLLMCVLLAGGVSGAWGQVTSITDRGLYSIRFARTDQPYLLGVRPNLQHDSQSSYSTAGVFQLILTETAGVYYIKERSTGKYVYASKTTVSSGSDIQRIALGNTELPEDDSSEDQDKKLSAYKWNFTYIGDKGSKAKTVWTIKPNQNTDVFWAVWTQQYVRYVAFYNGTSKEVSYDHYILGYVQFITPTLESMITAGCKVSEITSAGYTKDQIAEYYKPSTLDKAGWPTTTAYNTFKTAINALSDDAVVNTAYSTPYQTMCNDFTKPTIGAFYRLKDNNGNYVYATGINAQLAVAASPTNPMSSVFYTANTVDNIRFISLLNGYYIVNNYTEASNPTKIASAPGGFTSYQLDHSSAHPLGALRIKHTYNSSTYYWYSNNQASIYSSPNNATYNIRAFYFEEVTSLPITFKGKYASFYSPVDLTLPSGVKAYTGKLNGDNTKLTLSEVDYVPANTGVILEFAEFSSETSKDFPIRSTVTPVAETSLTGTVAAQSVSANTKLVLGKEENAWGIYAYGSEGTVTLGGFKAYMDKPAGGGSVKGFTFAFDDETAIEAITNALQATDKEIYNLAGQRIDGGHRQAKSLQRGVYIMNGKKVLVK